MNCMDSKIIKTDEILRKGLSEKENLYGIFDGAIIEDLWLSIDTWNLNTLPLYKGDYEKIAEAIPYVIELDKTRDKVACDTLLENIGKNATLFISSELGLETLTEKMQFFYHIKTSTGEAALRRFYDPRIFPGFIAGMKAENRLRFFENITQFFSELDQGQSLSSFKKINNELVRETHALVEVSENNKSDDHYEKANGN